MLKMDLVTYSVILMSLCGTFANETCSGEVEIIDGKLIMYTKNVCGCMRRNGLISTKNEDSVSSDTLNLLGGGNHLDFMDPANYCKYSEKPLVAAALLNSDTKIGAGYIILMVLAVVVLGALAAWIAMAATKKYQTTTYEIPPEQNVNVEMGHRNSMARASISTTGTRKSLLG